METLPQRNEHKEQLSKQIEQQIKEFKKRGGKIKRLKVKKAPEVKRDILARLQKGEHYITPDYRKNCK